ncbi:MAG: acyl-CoA dehydrogenase [Chloroflexi bacterium]|nr:acyl-CoA dehydrogenase [Chloroflexota bacterium]
MDFALTPEQEKLTQDFDHYLRTQMPAEVKADLEKDMMYPDSPACREFIRKMGRDGWLGIGWPKEYGGQGKGPIEQYLFYEIAIYHRAPLPVLPLNTIGPTLMRFGTEDQKKFFLPRILKGEMEISVGYTEPEAGSDLASLKTRAVKDGDYYVINGQKVFTTMGHTADYIWLATRTDPDAPKHKGISIFLIEAKTPGISMKPLYHLSGERSNATYYDDVRVHKSCLVGEENKGWKYITSQLDFERIMVSPSSYARRKVEDTMGWAKATKIDGKRVIDRPWVKRKLTELWMEVEVLRLMNLQVAWMISKGVVPYAEASMVKVYGSELYQRVNGGLMEIMGEFGQLQRGSKYAPLRGNVEHSFRLELNFIFGGGAIEVQRDIIAQVALGLPRM